MITLIKHGNYRLNVSKNQEDVLFLDETFVYVWRRAGRMGEYLLLEHKRPPVLSIRSEGKYRFYLVEHEKELSDGHHLELLTGKALWQGYLLPTGFPIKNAQSRAILPTQELISVSSVKTRTFQPNSRFSNTGKDGMRISV